MANALVKAQFMDPPGGPNSASPLGAVKAGAGITISADGSISTAAGGGTISDIVVSNGIQGGGQGPQVFLSLLPPAGTALGGVRTLPGSGISIDADGIIRNVNQTVINSTVGLNVENLGSGAFNINLKPAGINPAALGGVYVASLAGLTLATDGKLQLAPPILGALGGVKAGTGVTIDPDGTLNATGTGGTITGVGAGTGLGGGGVSGAVTLFLRPATSNTIGGVYPGENVTVDPDGRLNVSDAALGVLTVGGAAPVVITGTQTNPIVGVNPATTATTGIVQLNSAINSTSEAFAATPLAVKTVADIANAALPLAGGTLTGPVTFTAGQTFPGTISGSVFSSLGQLIVGDNNPPGYSALPLGTDGQVLTVNTAAPLGVEWKTSLANPTLQTVTTAGATTNVATTFQGVGGESTFTTVLTGRKVQMLDGVTELVLLDNQPGGSQLIHVGTNFTVFSGSGANTVKVGNRLLTGTVNFNAGDALNLQLQDTTYCALTSTGFAVTTPFSASGIAYPTADGTAGAALVTNGSGTLSFSTGFLQKSGGTMTGDITFSGTQTFPGVLAQGTLSGTSPIVVGGTNANPIISVSTATTGALGVVRPDGTTITINGSGVISAASATTPTLQQVTTAGATTTSSITVGGLTAAGIIYPSVDGSAGQVLTTDGAGNLSFTANFGASALPLTGGTMSGTITFAAGQTISGYVANTLLTTTGDIMYASSANTPARLGIGSAGTILGVNGGLPSWRTTAQLGLLTTAAASSTYAPLNAPTFTGPVIVNAGGPAGSNAFTVSGGNPVFATSFTPANQTDTGSTGEFAWDNNYFYICVSPNLWGRVAIDLTPF